MTGSGDRLGLGSSATGLALLVLRALAGAGSSLVYNPITGRMTVRCNLLLLYECKSAKTAYGAGGKTALGTSLSIAGHVNAVVSERLNESIATNLANLSIKAGSVNAGGMTERLTVGLTAGSAGLGSNAISVVPIVTERLTNLKGAKLAGHRSYASSIYKGMCAKGCNEGNGSILGNRRMLEAIGSDTVVNASGKLGKFLRCESVLNANHDVEY